MADIWQQNTGDEASGDVRFGRGGAVSPLAFAGDIRAARRAPTDKYAEAEQAAYLAILLTRTFSSAR